MIIGLKNCAVKWLEIKYLCYEFSVTGYKLTRQVAVARKYYRSAPIARLTSLSGRG